MGLIKVKDSYSTTFKKIDGIIQLMCREIDSCQQIKRLLAYPTNNPLDSRANTYNSSTNTSSTIYQYDVTKSMMKDISIDVSKAQDKSNMLEVGQSIYDMGWNSDKDIELKNSIYISHYYTGVDFIDKSVFIVTIVVPSDYNRLIDTSRSHALASHIIDLFDNSKTDTESSKDDGLGDLEFHLVKKGKITEGKIARKVDATIIEIPFEVSMINCKLDGNKKMVGNNFR